MFRVQSMLSGGIIFFVLLMNHLVLIQEVEAKPSTSCPQFIVKDGPDDDDLPDIIATQYGQNACRLHQDVVDLVSTVELNSGTKLDCQGHKITPVDKGLPETNTSRSMPPLAIFLHGAKNVEIRDCVLDGFDHGILAANSKEHRPGGERNILRGNIIVARFIGIHIVNADDFYIVDNFVTWLRRGGAGILLHLDSDDVTIKHNDITADFAPSNLGAVMMPGPTAMGATGPVMPSTLNSNPALPSGHAAILVLQGLGSHPQLFNAFVNGKLYQFIASDSPVSDSSFTENTIVNGNTLHFPSSNTTEDGIIASNSLGTKIRNNIIGSPDAGANVRQAARAGGLTVPRQFPGTCTQKGDRYCLSPFDCNIPNFDESTTDTCNLPAPLPVFWLPRDTSFEDNIIYGRFQNGIGSVAENTIISGNQILGQLPTGVTNGSGITLAGRGPLEDSVVTRNRISNVATSVRLMNAFGDVGPDFFGVRFSLNDISGYTLAALTTSADYSLPSELSVDAAGEVCADNAIDCVGNYWGEPCPGFDPAMVEFENGNLQPLLADHHSFGEPVAELSEELLPEVCE